MGRQAVSDDVQIHRAIDPDISGYETLARLNDDGLYELSVMVSGVHCASCIQKIESTLSREQDIQNARVNFSTQRLSLSWKGQADQANDFVRAVQKLGYGVQPVDHAVDEAQKSEERFLLLCLGVAGFAMGNIMLLSVGLWATSIETMGVATRDLMHWISAVIALPTILFAGRPFFYSAFKALRAGHANMDVPISLALLLAGGMSLFETINHGEHVYFDSALMLMFFLLIGRYLDFRAQKNARSAATDLLSSLSGFATVIDGKKTKNILIRDLKEGMFVRVSAGEKFPADGTITQGESDVDTSLITGESLPRAIKKGDNVFAGTMNMSAPVSIKIAKAAEDSLLADIVRLMEKAGQSQAKYVRLADRAAQLYTPIVHTMAIVAFLGWFFVGGLNWQDSLMIAITVLIITCPCALGLAVPVVQVLATGELMKKGILVKSGDALERLAKITSIMFDKTGTLTIGKPSLVGEYKKQDLKLAASLAGYSSHVLSKAVASSYDGPLFDIERIKENPGKGIEGYYKGEKVRLGRRSWCGDKSSPSSGHMEIWLSRGDAAPVLFTLSDRLRRDAKSVVESLKSKHYAVTLVSGDVEAAVKKAARTSGIDQYYAQKTPPEKFDILEDMKSEGQSVLMVGDGLNDAPVLAGADASMAPGTAIDMAQNAADIVFMGDDLGPVETSLNVAKKSQALIKQNFTLAVLYNVIAVPLALAGFVTPLVAAIAMSGSSLLVIANSFRLRSGL